MIDIRPFFTYKYFQQSLMEANMFAVNLLEEAGTGAGYVWIPVIVLGWFLLMTIVGWQVSRRNAGNGPQAADTSRSESNPSEFDSH